MTKEDAEKILRYLREPQFVLAKMPPGVVGGDTVYVSDIAPNFVVGDGTAYTVVYVPKYGAIHIEAFMKECKELGIDTDRS